MYFTFDCFYHTVPNIGGFEDVKSQEMSIRARAGHDIMSTQTVAKLDLVRDDAISFFQHLSTFMTGPPTRVPQHIEVR